MKELFITRYSEMNTAQETKQHHNPRGIHWLAALVILLTFLVVDTGALAWSAAVSDGRQIAAEVFTFIAVMSGAAITVWKMRVG